MPSNPQRSIIALSCGRTVSLGREQVKASNLPRPRVNLNFIDKRCQRSGLIGRLNNARTGSGQHLFASEDRVGTRQEAHRLLSLCEGLPTSGETNDTSRKDNAGCRNCSNELVFWDGLHEI